MNATLLGFIIGISIGLVILLYAAFRFHLSKRSLEEKVAESEKKAQDLRKMLQDRMELENEGLAKLKAECEDLKKRNDNLRISLEVLAQKPGRKELQRLDVMSRAVERLTVENPGFATAWQIAMNKSEEEMRLSFFGNVPLLRRFVKGSKNSSYTDVEVNDGGED